MADRREFIKSSCTVCLGILTAASAAALFEGCTTLPLYKTSVINDMIAVPLVEILPGEKFKLIRSESLDYDILLVLRESKDHRALLMKCTHADNILIATSDSLTCNMHGSTFDFDGKVTTGPANIPLTRFETTEDNNNILIHLKKS